MTLSEFHFIRPYWLLALLPYLILLGLLVRRKLSHGNWTAVCDAALLPFLLQDKAVAQSRLPLATGAVAAFLAIVALAGPTWERLPTPVFRNDSALVIVLDLSRSMDAADIKPSRLVMARYKIADILKQRKDGQTALIVYADEAFTVTSLTNDTETIANQLSALTTAIMPREGNNTARVLKKAEALFKQAGLQKGQILLITDGGNIDDALSKAKSLDAYQLLVLGVGTSGGAPIALNTGGFLKDDQGNIVVDKLNISSLEKLAQAGNGSYQSLTSDDADIQALLSTLISQSDGKGEKNENLLLDQWRDVGPWLLLLVLPMAALSFRKGLLGLIFVLLLPLPKTSYALDVERAWQDLWQTKDQQAQAAYSQGDFNNAAELFENPDWKAAAYYRSGAFDKALEQQKQEQKQDQQQDQDKKPDSQDQKDQEQKQGGDKSGQSQDKDQENKDEQKEADQKPEQKPEQSQQSTEQQPEKADAEQQKEKQADAADTNKDDKKPDTAQAQPLDAMSNEEKQANEQWLKRIPDDPAGLLKRKFKYQYDQRGRQ